jgi:type II secretory pathway pseudopilin PulG
MLMIVTAVALFVAPWIVGYPDTAKEAHRNELGVGMIVFFIALARFSWYPGKWPDLVVLAAGLWLIASPWVISLQKTEVFDGAQVVDVVIGVVLVALASLSLLLLALTKKAEKAEKAEKADEAEKRGDAPR